MWGTGTNIVFERVSNFAYPEAFRLPWHLTNSAHQQNWSLVFPAGIAYGIAGAQ